MNPIKSVFQTSSDWADQANVSHDSFATIGSTNDHAKSLSLDIDFFDQPKLVLANVQTQGRGRGDNQWISVAEDMALYSSWVFDVRKAPQPITSPLIGLATFEALKKTWPEVSFALKAPNDIYVHDKKLCGLLIELVNKGEHHRLIIGLGINVLKHPQQISESTHLLEHLDDFLTVEQWHTFLDQLIKNYKYQLRLITASELEKADRVMLKKALSACPLYTDKIQDVSPAGDLIFDNHVQSWHDL